MQHVLNSGFCQISDKNTVEECKQGLIPKNCPGNSLNYRDIHNPETLTISKMYSIASTLPGFPYVSS